MDNVMLVPLQGPSSVLRAELRPGAMRDGFSGDKCLNNCTDQV